MSIMLNAIEVRVLGALVEKEITTPDYYPLTLNALVLACNQKSNRDPVVSFDETIVVRALDGLREKDLAWMTTADGRVPKYKHRFPWAFNLTPPEVAVLCELMLRGPQTVGELRGHAERMYQFKEMAEVETTLQRLITREEPMVTKLPRQVGRKESRYAHRLAGEPQIEAEEITPRLKAGTLEVRAENETISRLEAEIQTLRQEFEDLKQQFIEFRRQFE
ncbi:MAG: DUF480 domain-containing protein [Acidobacteria bacterium]|nr:DUF480 domain-containing protein [Acidobacteriota bacterium]